MRLSERRQRVLLPTVGRCIYCGTTEGKLSREHVHPEGLGGFLELPEASCWSCQKIINREIETPLLDKHWADVRAMSRLDRGHRRTIKARSRNGGTVKIPVEDFPAPLVMYRFGTAKRMPQRLPVEPKWEPALSSGSPEHEERCKAKYPAWDGTHSFIMIPDIFARQIAKIALGWAVNAVGYGNFVNTVSPIILGDEPDWALAVGGELDDWRGRGDSTQPPSYFSVPTSNEKAVFGVELSLFNNPSFPRYHVVVGEQYFKVGSDQQTVTFSGAPIP